MNKNRLLDLFANIKEEPKLNLGFNSRILLVDGMNTFLRAFSAVNQINRAGHHIGGLTGFLLSLGSAIRALNPTRVVIVFDGEAGSQNRKYLLPEYKANRNQPKISNYKSFTNKDEEDEAKVNQIVRLMDYLKLLPVNCMCIDRLEADDIIGFLCSKLYAEYRKSLVFVMSTDQDYMQLVNDRVSVYSPKEKKVYGVEQVVEKYGIHPDKFLIYKTLLGDNSDNIKGVYGLGEKKIMTMFPQLKEPQRMTLNEVFEHAELNVDYNKLFPRILESEKKLAINYQIMNLHEPNVSNQDMEDLLRQFNRTVKPLQKYDIIKLYQHDKLGNAIEHVDSWLNLFAVLNNF